MSHDGHEARSLSSPDGGYRAWFWPLLALYLTCALFGYGNDDDTYGMIQSGQRILLQGTYVPSRPPGCLPVEIVVGVTSLVGGCLLSNAISVALGLGALSLFRRLLKHGFGEANKDVATAVTVLVGLNPLFVVAATSSMDYVYSLFLGLLGTTLLHHRRHAFAAAAFGLGIGARLSNILLFAWVFLYFLLLARRRQESGEPLRIVAAAVGTLAFASLMFIPSYLASGHTLGFMTYTIGDWTLFGHFARLVYKNLLLVGLLPLLAFLVIGALPAARSRRPRWGLECWMATGLIVSQEVLFFQIPLEPSYLLPILFAAIPLWVMFASPSRTALTTVIALTLSYGFVVNIDILDPRFGDRGRGTEVVAATLGIFLRPGLVLADLQQRQGLLPMSIALQSIAKFSVEGAQ